MDFYRKHGLDVMSFDVPTGVKSREAVVQGSAKLGIAAANAISTATDEQLAKIKILGSITQTSATVSIISREPIAQLDLNKATIGYVPGTISEFYLVAYLRSIGQLERYTSQSLKLIKLPPTSLITAFMEGDVTTVVPWEPFGEQIRILAADKKLEIDIFRQQELYRQQIYLISRRDAPAKVQDGIKRALKDSCDYIEKNRKSVAKKLEDDFKFKSGFLSNSDIWKSVSFKFIDDMNNIMSTLSGDLELAEIAEVAQIKDKNTLASLTK